MIKKKVLVTGSNGQLGECLIELSTAQQSNFDFFFTTNITLDITEKGLVLDYFKAHDFDFCINCAAYTAVDKAEEELKLAHSVNAKGAEILAKACLEYNTTLIHVSTDFVFDGNSKTPYKETDQTKPISIYGSTKLEGENNITSILNKYFILRTSWLYSEYGNNFVKTMLRLRKERDELSVVADQVGTPTYAKDLASVILKIIANNKKTYGLYHYSNEGEVSWYDFAKKIFEISKTKIQLFPIKTEAYPTPAKRPKYSVMDKTKIKTSLGVQLNNWEDSLKKCLLKLQ